MVRNRGAFATDKKMPGIKPGNNIRWYNSFGVSEDNNSIK
jgi:hypothetical protein